MKNNLKLNRMLNLQRLILFLLMIFFMSCGNDKVPHSGHGEHEKQSVKKIYTCVMHPEVIRDKPGKCPVCGMDLVEKKITDVNHRGMNFPDLIKPANEYVLSHTKKINLKEMELPVEFSAIGNVTYDPQLVNTVSARVTGRIEKLHVKSKYQSIQKGDKLMDIYSKDLLTEQENYLYLLKNDSENETIIQAAKTKLMLMGLTVQEIRSLKSSGKVIPAITIYSPYSGHLHDFSSMDRVTSMGMGNSNYGAPGFLIKEGMYVEKGQVVFNIYGTGKVWVKVSVYPDGQNFIKVGQKIKLQIDGIKNMITAHVNFIEPSYTENQKAVYVRVYLDNPNGNIKIGAIVRATLSGEKRKGYYLPSTAVLNLGLNNIVFVKQGKLLRAIPINTGLRINGWQEIVSGVGRADSVAENAQLLMDSESFVKITKQ